ncbi:MAG: alpha/beta hydrolase family protein [Jatrophihabitantaceae bacterium]
MTITRRRLLAGALGASALASCSGQTAVVSTHPSTRHAYGRDPSQFGELYRPHAAARPGTVVIIHGGFWRAQYDLSLGAPLAADLAARGWTAWNLEYRRVGGGGGWPATLSDVAAGIDLLATLHVDTSRVVAVGHSAGGQLAVWAAGRAELAADAPGAEPRVQLRAAVSQAGVLDLVTAADQQIGGSAVADLLGGAPGQVPSRYADADPIHQVPLRAPVLCVHSRSDTNVPFAQSAAYVAAATSAGADARLAEVSGDHFTLIDPKSSDWTLVVDALPGLLSA